MSATKKRKSATAKSWNIKGIEPETRQRVTKAAKRSGMTIGAYINRVLMEASTNDLKREKHLPVKMEDLQTQLSQMSDAIVKLTNKMDQPKKSWKSLFWKDDRPA